MSSDPFGLSKQRIEELRLAWNTIKHSRNIKTDSFKLSHFLSVLKTLGVDLTQQELRVLQQEYDIRGEFTFEDLAHVGSVTWTEEVLEESLLTALESLDPQRTGKVKIYELRQLLYKLGIGMRLTLAEIDTFFEQFEEVHTGYVSIDKFILR